MIFSKGFKLAILTLAVFARSSGASNTTIISNSSPNGPYIKVTSNDGAYTFEECQNTNRGKNCSSICGGASYTKDQLDKVAASDKKEIKKRSDFKTFAAGEGLVIGLAGTGPGAVGVGGGFAWMAGSYYDLCHPGEYDRNVKEVAALKKVESDTSKQPCQNVDGFKKRLQGILEKANPGTCQSSGSQENIGTSSSPAGVQQH